MVDLHYEHNLWSNELSFFKEELKILENRLKEILAKNTGRRRRKRMRNRSKIASNYSAQESAN